MLDAGVDAAPEEKKVAASDYIFLMLFEQRQGSLAFLSVVAGVIYGLTLTLTERNPLHLVLGVMAALFMLVNANHAGIRIPRPPPPGVATRTQRRDRVRPVLGGGNRAQRVGLLVLAPTLMTRPHPNRSRRWLGLVTVCMVLVGSACGSDGNAATLPASEIDAGRPISGHGSRPRLATITIHSYLGPSLNTGNYVVESSTSLVIVDTGYRGGDPEEFRAAVDSLDKPISTVLITHDHPDHVGGLNTAFADVPVATTAAVAELIDAGNRDIEILDGAFTIDGIDYIAEEYLDVEAQAQMVITLPDHDAIFTGDLVFNETHLFLTPHLDRWISILEELQIDSPSRVYPGHGPPADPAVYGETIDYIRTAQANLAARRAVRSTRPP